MAASADGLSARLWGKAVLSSVARIQAFIFVLPARGVKQSCLRLFKSFLQKLRKGFDVIPGIFHRPEGTVFSGNLLSQPYERNAGNRSVEINIVPGAFQRKKASSGGHHKPGFRQRPCEEKASRKAHGTLVIVGLSLLPLRSGYQNTSGILQVTDFYSGQLRKRMPGSDLNIAGRFRQDQVVIIFRKNPSLVTERQIYLP